MTKLSRSAAPIYPVSESRRSELDALGVPTVISNLCVRPNVWRKQWANTTLATFGNQEQDRVLDLDWIEYIP